MDPSKNPFTRVAQAAARQTAHGLRAWAGMLEHLSGGGQDGDDDTAQQEAPQAATRTATRRGPAKRGTARRPQASSRPKALDDVTIARKVETELFRDPAVPKGDIDVNVADGVLFLR